MIRCRLLLALGLVLFGCARDRSDYDYQIPHPGPTLLAKVARGYELKNRWMRLVIDPASGDASYWGAADGDPNLLGPAGIRARIVGAVDVAPDGYVEQRDEQTWQYHGDDPNRIRWRKVYSLDGESVYATFLVENLSDAPRDVTIALRFDLPPDRIAGDDLRLQGPSPIAPVFIQGFRENRTKPRRGDDTPTLRSDTYTLKPRERISFTTHWRIDHPRRAREG